MPDKVRWDDTCLIVDSQEITILGEKIMFYELPQQALLAFLKEASAVEMTVEVEREVIDVDPADDRKTIKVMRKIMERRKSDEVGPETRAVTDKYLSLATVNPNVAADPVGKPAKSVEYFANLPLSQFRYGKIVEFVLFNLQHTDDILAVSGNLLLLPKFWAAQEAENVTAPPQTT